MPMNIVIWEIEDDELLMLAEAAEVIGKAGYVHLKDPDSVWGHKRAAAIRSFLLGLWAVAIQEEVPDVRGGGDADAEVEGEEGPGLEGTG